jgi:hypothetical protein
MHFGSTERAACSSNADAFVLLNYVACFCYFCTCWFVSLLLNFISLCLSSLNLESERVFVNRDVFIPCWLNPVPDDGAHLTERCCTIHDACNVVITICTCVGVGAAYLCLC